MASPPLSPLTKRFCVCEDTDEGSSDQGANSSGDEDLEAADNVCQALSNLHNRAEEANNSVEQLLQVNIQQRPGNSLEKEGNSFLGETDEPDELIAVETNRVEQLLVNQICETVFYAEASKNQDHDQTSTSEVDDSSNINITNINEESKMEAANQSDVMSDNFQEVVERNSSPIYAMCERDSFSQTHTNISAYLGSQFQDIPFHQENIVVEDHDTNPQLGKGDFYVDVDKTLNIWKVNAEASSSEGFSDDDDGGEHELSSNRTTIVDGDRQALIDALLAIGEFEQMKTCSTPVKQAPPAASFKGLLPLSPIIDVLSDNTSDSSDSENDSNSSCMLEEDIDSSDLLQEGSENVPDFIPDSSFVALNNSRSVSLDQIEQDAQIEQEHAIILREALNLNNIKIHKDSYLSVNEAILHIMKLYVKNKQSKSGLHRAIKTICSFLPEDHKVPTSSHLVLRYIERLAPPVPHNVHYFCQDCLLYHGTSIVGPCEVCRVETKFGHFFSFDIAALIKFFFESKDLALILDSEDRINGDPSVVRDIRDGSVYKLLNRNRGKYDLNLILNSDGVRIRKGSTKELWLVMFTIADLPVHLQKSFLTVIGVWYHVKKPDMKTFLKPFAEEMQLLDRNCGGVEWTHPTSKERQRSRVRLIVTVLDAPARAMTQNLMSFNSRYGCNLCETKTKLTAPVRGKKRLRVYYYEHNPKLRTKENMIKQAEEVGERKHFKGVRGPSVLSIIPSVDISQCIVPEYLHSVLLGVCKQVILIWISKPGPWSIKAKIPELDIFLKTFKHPSFVHRSLRQLKYFKYWKASDLYYFMFFELLLTLKGHLPDLYLQHFTLLIIAIFKLLKTSINEVEIEEADILLKLFVNDFCKLYGDRQLTSNLHQLLHLALCVKRFGPLHCYSAFMYEDLNGLIAKKTHGTNHVDVEIVNNIKICQGIHSLQNIVTGNEPHVFSDSFSQGEFLGKEIITMLLQEDLDILHDCNPKIFSRAKLGYDVYSSEIHKKLQSENFNVMWTENGCPKYGSIKYFAQTVSGKFVVIRMFVVDHTQVFYQHETLKCVEHLIPVQTTQSYVAIRLCNIVSSVMKVGKQGSYLYKRPNPYRYVM